MKNIKKTKEIKRNAVVYSAKYSLPKPKTFKQQINILKNKHQLKVNKNELLNEKIVKNTNYYVLKNYAITAEYIRKSTIKKTNYIYKKKIDLNDIYNLYLFDIKLKNILIYAIGIIEKNFRSCFSNYLTTKYKDSECLDNEYYQNKKPFNIINKTIKSINKKIDKHEINDELTISFAKMKHIPLWLVIESFSFGDLYYFYKGLKTSSLKDDPDDDKHWLAQQYGLTKGMFECWLNSIRFVRNICSHFNRLTGRKLISLRTGFLNIDRNESQSVFSFIKIIGYLMKSIDAKQWYFISSRLHNLFDKNKTILKDLKFPSNWRSIFSRRIINKRKN